MTNEPTSRPDESSGLDQQGIASSEFYVPEIPSQSADQPTENAVNMTEQTEETPINEAAGTVLDEDSETYDYEGVDEDEDYEDYDEDDYDEDYDDGSEDDEPQKKRIPAWVYVIIALAIAGVVVAIVSNVWLNAGGGGAFFDDAAQGGQAPYKTDEEIQAELDRIVQEGMLNISIASVIEFDNGSSPGIAYIENVPANKYVLRVTIALDENGEVVYQSGGIRPDSFIETITLSQNLSAGEYPATATFTAYDPDSLEEIGQAGAKIMILVHH